MISNRSSINFIIEALLGGFSKPQEASITKAAVINPHQICSYAAPVLPIVILRADITSLGVNKRVVVKRNADVNPQKMSIGPCCFSFSATFPRDLTAFPTNDRLFSKLTAISSNSPVCLQHGGVH